MPWNLPIPVHFIPKTLSQENTDLLLYRATTISLGASKDAKLYIGLVGGSTDPDFISPALVKDLVTAYIDVKNFGGIMLWDATSSDNTDMSVFPGYTGLKYWAAMKQILNPYAPTPTATVSIAVSTTSSSSSSSLTSSDVITTSKWLNFEIFSRP